jgi:hypothetical protein
MDQQLTPNIITNKSKPQMSFCEQNGLANNLNFSNKYAGMESNRNSDGLSDKRIKL